MDQDDRPADPEGPGPAGGRTGMGRIMKRTDTIIIGGGQAGLAMSKQLADRGIDHVVLERGQVAERWRNERWDSLTMLTPRWQSRLPGWSYRGTDPDGFMSKSEVVDYLDSYATAIAAPVKTGVTVASVRRDGREFVLSTDSERWRAQSVVIATGHCGHAYVPSMAAGLSGRVEQVVPTRYRNPQLLRTGGVLVVGASATGIQLASEIARSGRKVTLAVGRHIRLPRNYRGRDIMAWFDTLGILREQIDDVRDAAASRHQPSLQLVGSDDHRSLDLNVLQREGVRLVGRMTGAAGERVAFAQDLADTIRHAEVKMHEQLDRVDRYVDQGGLETIYPAQARPTPVVVPSSPGEFELSAESIDTVLWATGYRRDYPWLQVPVLDSRGELIHEGGVTPVPGLYALGLNFMRRRNSAFIDGVGADAADIADHLLGRMANRYVAVA
jgi:putative flavoprotein involved in K+ transport